MEKFVNSDFKLGIITGGQLGKMLIQEASKWDLTSYVLDTAEDCPAGKLASKVFIGDYKDYDAVYNFGKQVDILTFEIEHVNIQAVKQLKAEGHKIIPDPDILELIQDKGLQKEFYQNHNLPTSPFQLYESKEKIIEAIDSGKITQAFVQKSRKGGYDGRGVAVISDLNNHEEILNGPSLVEEKVDIDKEIAVIVARNQQGQVKCYPVVEMTFDPKANLVDKLICPAQISQEQTNQAIVLATKIAELLDMQGLLAVEIFVDKKGQLQINEVAPRPHNSGHHTIESVVTSQFEQHLRAVLNLPLGSTELKLPSVMINIVGNPGYTGPVKYQGLEECLAIDGVKIHLYGKKITKPYRKMGHSTILAKSLEQALTNSEKVKNLIKVIS